MAVAVRELSKDKYEALLGMEESHFVDLKAAEITPAALTKTVSAFCNTGGGEVFSESLRIPCAKMLCDPAITSEISCLVIS